MVTRVNIKISDGKFSFPPDKNGAVSKGRWGNRVRVKGQLLSLPSLAKHLNGKIKDDKLDNSLKLKRGLFGYDKKKVKNLFNEIYPVAEGIKKPLPSPLESTSEETKLPNVSSQQSSSGETSVSNAASPLYSYPWLSDSDKKYLQEKTGIDPLTVGWSSKTFSGLREYHADPKHPFQPTWMKHFSGGNCLIVAKEDGSYVYFVKKAADLWVSSPFPMQLQAAKGQVQDKPQPPSLSGEG